MHDSAYKLLFSFPEMVRDLLAGFVPREWTDTLDLSTLARWPGDHVSEDLRQRHQDRVWRVRGGDRWLYLLVLLEFQSTVDRIMAVRILEYTAMLYRDLLRGSTAALPPVLPLVLYDGPGPWTAVREVAGLSAPPGAPLAPYQPAQRYFLLEVRRYTGALPEGRNCMAELLRLARSRDVEEMRATFGRGLGAWLTEPEHEGLIRAFWAWMNQVQLPARGVRETLPPLNDWREATSVLNRTSDDWTAKWREKGRIEGQTEVMRRLAPEGARELPPARTPEEVAIALEESVAEWPKQWLREGLEQGLEHERALLRRMAAARFGAAVEAPLAGRLAGITDPERLAEIGEWLVRCDTAEEFLDRVERPGAASADGDAPSRG